MGDRGTNQDDKDIAAASARRVLRVTRKERPPQPDPEPPSEYAPSPKPRKAAGAGFLGAAMLVAAGLAIFIVWNVARDGNSAKSGLSPAGARSPLRAAAPPLAQSINLSNGPIEIELRFGRIRLRAPSKTEQDFLRDAGFSPDGVIALNLSGLETWDIRPGDLLYGACGKSHSQDEAVAALLDPNTACLDIVRDGVAQQAKRAPEPGNAP